jgi:hypothetical protein
MKKILIAWELGAGLGHVSRVAALARTLASNCLNVHVALRDLSDSSLTVWPSDMCLHQAPVCFRVPTQFSHPATYAEVLYTNGYHNPRVLDGLTAGWTTMLELIDPDLVIVDHAPTAILATKIMGIPCARLGTGFFAPPACSPYPNFRSWQTFDAKRALAVEQYVLSAINAVLATVPLRFETVHAALQPELDAVCSWPELDHYAQHRQQNSVHYMGHETSVSLSGATPTWPGVRTKRVLAYLKHDYAALAEVLQGLEQQTQSEVQAYVAGFTPEQAAQWSCAHLRIYTQPLALEQMLNGCAGVLCHAGSGTVALCLEAGIPVFLLPYTAEQFMYAHLCVQNHFGFMQSDLEARQCFLAHFTMFLTSYDLVPAIQAAKQRNRILSTDAIEGMVDECITRWQL